MIRNIVGKMFHYDLKNHLLKFSYFFWWCLPHPLSSGWSYKQATIGELSPSKRQDSPQVKPNYIMYLKYCRNMKLFEK